MADGYSAIAVRGSRAFDSMDRDMQENFALYSRTYDSLPEDRMLMLVDSICPSSEITDRGLTYTYRWPDLTILVSAMPSSELPDHLRGFEGYLRRGIYGGKVPDRGERIIRRILATRLVIGVELQPGRDEQERADELVGRMAGGLRPIIFHRDELFDWMSRLLLARDGSFDPDAELD